MSLPKLDAPKTIRGNLQAAYALSKDPLARDWLEARLFQIASYEVERVTKEGVKIEPSPLALRAIETLLGVDRPMQEEDVINADDESIFGFAADLLGAAGYRVEAPEVGGADQLE